MVCSSQLRTFLRYGQFGRYQTAWIREVPLYFPKITSHEGTLSMEPFTWHCFKHTMKTLKRMILVAASCYQEASFMSLKSQDKTL